MYIYGWMYCMFQPPLPFCQSNLTYWSRLMMALSSWLNIASLPSNKIIACIYLFYVTIYFHSTINSLTRQCNVLSFSFWEIQTYIIIVIHDLISTLF